MPEWRLKRILENPKIVQMLSHSKLKVIIKEIDGAANHRKKAMLRRRIKIDLDF